VSESSTSCYELLGVRSDAGLDEIERAWTQRREAALARSSELSEEQLAALVSRLDEAYAIVSDPTRSNLYGTYLKQTELDGQVEGPEVFGALYAKGPEGGDAMADDRGTTPIPMPGPALQTLAEVVMAAPAPEEGRVGKGSVSIDTSEIAPWLDRPTPTGDVPVTPHIPAEAQEENFLTNLEVQDRLGALHNHLAAADLIRKERNELLRQVVNTRAELEMRTSAEVELRNALDARDHTMEEIRRDLEHFRTVGEEALADVLDLQTLRNGLAEELVVARDQQEAAELTAKGARADLEAVRVRVLQLEERIGGQDALLEGERKVAESLRDELTAADKRRQEADASANQALEAYRSVDAKLAAKDSRITELEERLSGATRRTSDADTARVEAESRRDEAMSEVAALLDRAKQLQTTLEDTRAELAEARLRSEELASESRLQVRRVAEMEIAKSSVEADYETLRSTLVDTRRALELSQQEAERQQQRLENAESAVKDRESQCDERQRLVEQLREELGGAALKIEETVDSLEFAKAENEARLRRIMELEGAAQVRQREVDEARRDCGRLETDLEGSRREVQRKTDQLNHSREELRRQKDEHLNLRRQLGQRQNEIERLRREVRGSEKRHSQELQEVRYQEERAVLEQQELQEELELLRSEGTQQRNQIRLQYSQLSELAQQRDELAEVLEEDGLGDDELGESVDDIMALVRG